jgi:hypothetical protein
VLTSGVPDVGKPMIWIDAGREAASDWAYFSNIRGSSTGFNTEAITIVLILFICGKT